MHGKHNGITADENDNKQLQLHIQGASKVNMQVWAHDKRLACLGVDKYSGKKWETTAEKFAGNSSLPEGAVYRQGQSGYFHYVNP